MSESYHCFWITFSAYSVWMWIATLSILPTLDWAAEISQQKEVTVVSGFHSRMERGVKILLRGKYSLIAFTSTPWAHRAGHFPSMTGQHTSRAISKPFKPETFNSLYIFLFISNMSYILTTRIHFFDDSNQGNPHFFDDSNWENLHFFDDSCTSFARKDGLRHSLGKPLR